MSSNEIKAGSAVLDKKAPGWMERINFELLDLGNTCFCVVGQTYPDRPYGEALMELLDEEDEQVALNMSHQYGFDVPPDGNSEDYVLLTQEWKEYILERIA